jgi:hypothetical protein
MSHTYRASEWDLEHGLVLQLCLALNKRTKMLAVTIVISCATWGASTSWNLICKMGTIATPIYGITVHMAGEKPWKVPDPGTSKVTQSQGEQNLPHSPLPCMKKVTKNSETCLNTVTESAVVSFPGNTFFVQL